MERGGSSATSVPSTARVSNPEGRSPFVIICDHASNHLPPSLGSLGLGDADMLRHIAWDPGALPVAAQLATALDAPLVEAGISRLAIDCNRPLDAPDLIPEISETTIIPGNAGLTVALRDERIALSWTPFHDAIDALVSQRMAAGTPTMLVSVHSFNPVYRDVPRPWHIGIIHDDDTRLAGPMIAALQRLAGVVVGINEPYSPADRVYFTLERHGRSRGLACAMIEIRNDEISAEAGQRKWADLLTGMFAGLVPEGGLVASLPPKTGAAVRSMA